MERRLAAILAADVVGYSRQMGADEAGTMSRLRALRAEVIDPLLAEYRGRLFKTTGDGFLAEFGSAVQALTCAIAIQERQRETPDALQLRIGLHSGDVLVEGDDLFGDGVNIAARIEPLAEPGGIAMSARVREDAAGKITLNVEDIGTQELKNIAAPVRVFRVRLAAPERPALALPDKPSLVVLPFQNMSGDPEQEYFVDGLVEDITTALSCIRSLFVIARNSAFTYKGRAVDIRQVGRDLGVRYVLEGSVRKSGNRLRITGQLIEAETGAHLWANRYDGALDDVFDLQDQITSSVAGAIEPNLQQAEIERAQRKPTGDLSAYDYYLRGMALVHASDISHSAAAATLFAKAYEADPGYAAAYGAAAHLQVLAKSYGLLRTGSPEETEAIRLARLAAALGRTDAIALRWAATVLQFVGRDVDGAGLLIRRACDLNPNSAQVRSSLGWNTLYAGDPTEAIAHLARAQRLSPLDPLIFQMQLATAMAHFFSGRYDDAISWTRRSLNSQAHPDSYRFMAAALALSDRRDEAQQAIGELARLAPQLRLSNAHEWMPAYRRPEYATRLLDGLRRAGLPE